MHTFCKNMNISKLRFLNSSNDLINLMIYSALMVMDKPIINVHLFNFFPLPTHEISYKNCHNYKASFMRK